MNSSTVQRLLSMKDRHSLGKNHARAKSISAVTTNSEPLLMDYYGLFSFNTKGKSADAQEEQKVKTLRKRVMETKSINLQDSQILYALHSLYASGDLDKAFELLIAMSNSWEGLLPEYEPGVKLLGAVNRNGVTCYLDSILFAMFSRLECFEAMLYKVFQDNTKNKLAMLIRLWVNLLRSGKLITTDVTQLLQESLAECGWKEAAETHQQDASEAFTFITEKLELPLLTLKMDIYHTGKEDAADDHKFVNERLLEVAIPFDPADPDRTIPLEDCLEAYFNNRIEVKRYLERRSNLHPAQAPGTPDSMSPKGGAVHIETVESAAESPSQAQSKPTPFSLGSPLRGRATSIVQQRFIPDKSDSSDPPAYEADTSHPLGRLRSGSIRKEVLMPAWQFFSLIPWYTNNTPRSDAQVAAHFSAKRPILGMCLKRYSFTENGNAIRLSTHIDIPTEIGLPYFISDDSMDEDGPIYGNFKLSLQSVVCHRGKSVHSGHYISLVKGTNASSKTESDSKMRSTSDTTQWMRFDDLAPERITLVDINQALKDETPYLLFYQILPIDDDPGSLIDGESLPLYAPSDAHDSGIGGASVDSLKVRGLSDEVLPPNRKGSEITAAPPTPQCPSPTDEQRRQSVTFSEPASQGEPAVSDTEPSQADSRPESIIGTSGSQSRSQSHSGEKFTISLPRITTRRSREVVLVLGNTAEVDFAAEESAEPLAAEDGRGKGFRRREGKREKSKGRLSRVSAKSGKVKGEKPDRECSVM